MTALRVFIGGVVGAAILAVTIHVASFLDVHPSTAVFAWCVAAAGVFELYIGRQSRQALAHYWKRKCTGAILKKRFPASSKVAIRQFLGHFVDAFMFPRRELAFAPDDRVMDVYRVLYPDRSMPDCLEVETFLVCSKRITALTLPAFGMMTSPWEKCMQRHRPNPALGASAATFLYRSGR